MSFFWYSAVIQEFDPAACCWFPPGMSFLWIVIGAVGVVSLFITYAISRFYFFLFSIFYPCIFSPRAAKSARCAIWAWQIHTMKDAWEMRRLMQVEDGLICCVNPEKWYTMEEESADIKYFEPRQHSYCLSFVFSGFLAVDNAKTHTPLHFHLEVSQVRTACHGDKPCVGCLIKLTLF